MTQLALGVVGAVVGSFIAPGIGTAIGWSIGSAVGGLLDPPKSQGPRLSDLKLQGSSYGSFIGIAYGTVRLAGDVIWQTDLAEHSHTEGGGKGGPETTSYTYTASFAIQVCEGPISSILKVWADGRLIYDRSPGAATSALPMVIYLGGEDQLPDPTIEAVEGAGNVPAHRGTAYVVFTDYELADYGNRIPSMTFQVLTQSHSDAAIHIVKVLSDPNSPPLIWQGGFFHQGIKPIVLEWTTNGEVRIKGAGTATVAVYNSDLLHVRDDEADRLLDESIDEQFLQQIHHSGSSWHYYAVGFYYIDEQLEPVWACPSLPVPASHQFPALAATSVFLDSSEFPDTANSFAASAGIPTGEYVAAAVLSQDQTMLFVFTSPTTPVPDFPIVNKWYKLINASVIDRGTVDPPLAYSVLGFGAQRAQTYNAVQFENNGKWMWWFYGAGLGNCTASVYEIVDGNFALNTVCTPLHMNADTGVPNEPQGFNYPSCMVLEDGYCGVVFGQTLAVVSRFPVSDSLKIPLSDIVSDISERCGLTADEYNVAQLTDLVHGYSIGATMDGRAAINLLLPVFFFDGVESDGVVKFVKRGREPVATITEDDLAAATYGSKLPSLFEVVRTDDDALPTSVTVTYINPDADYQTSAQTQKRQTAGKAVVTFEAAIVLEDNQAKQIVDALLFTPWLERNRRTFKTTRAFLNLEPCDVVTVADIDLRITRKTETADGIIEFEALPALTSVYSQPSVGGTAGGFVPPTVNTGSPMQANLLMLDIPLIDDDDSEGFYAAMAGLRSSEWRGGTLYRSNDNGATYTEIAHSSSADVIGTCSTILGEFLGGNIFDEMNSVTVVVGHGGGTLASSTAEAVANGANKALVGSEIIQYRDAVLIAEGTYYLTGLLRGRRGTEWAIGTHGSSERFVVLPTSINVSSAELNVSRLYKAVPAGRTLASATAVTFANTGAAVRPYAVVQIGGGFDAAGNCAMQWVRRTRVGGEWVGYVDVPLSEASERYTVEVWDSAFTTLKRTITGLTSPAATYTAAQQVEDFGGTQAIVYAKIYQNGRMLPSRGVRAHFPDNRTTWTSDLEPTPGPLPPTTALRTIPFTWASAGSLQQKYSADFGGFADIDSISIRFTTPAGSSANVGRISLVEFADPPVERIACLSTISGDFDTGIAGQPFSKQVGIGIAFRFTVGVPVAYAVQLDPSTTYYLNLRNGATSYSSCNIQITLQQPSGL